MKYISTRDVNLEVNPSQAIVQGISKDGGLFVPSFFPRLEKDEIINLIPMKYEERAAYILSKYLTDYEYDEILEYTSSAYSKFDEKGFPLVKIDDKLNILELWHGPTAAFKDAALSLLPYLMVASKRKIKEDSNTLILVATSGDTGKAALEGFKNIDGTNIIVFYPSEGVSPMQKLQMKTQDGNNVYVAAIKGNFDDAQTAVKKMFQDDNLKEKLLSNNIKFSSANSINWGRLVPQIVYYISSYVDLIANKSINYGEKINICVPTGNFGNILAAFYSKQMGLPVNKLICASNSNNILTDFLQTGVYDTNREFYKTMSPSMDILVSSNLERLIFEMSGRDDKYIKDKMDLLKNSGKYSVESNLLKKIQDIFVGGYATESDTLDTISYYQERCQYLLDTHTAVAVKVYNDYVKKTGDVTPVVIASTANPYKFPCDVYKAVSKKGENDAFVATENLAKITKLPIPKPLTGLKEKKVRFDSVWGKDKIRDIIIDYVEIM